MTRPLLSRPLPRLAFLLPLALAACAAPQDDYPCDCVEVPTDESSIAMTGFPLNVILSEGGERVDDRTDVEWIQYDTALATPEMLAAAPGNTCGYWGKTVVSTRFADSFPDDLEGKQPGGRYIVITCADPAEGASQ